MSGFLRFLAGLLLLPACWGVARACADAICVSAGTCGACSVEALALLGGMVAFVACWLALPHPVRTYVLGHELTHAIWGLLFGARPSDLRVGAAGGSVRLSKTNFIITLAPYFFPFYTFVVIVAGLITSAFLRPLPFLPLWLFLVGFTWAFHILFTLGTLTERQPDVRTYGRVFSWVIIFLANLALVLVWLASTTSLTFARLGSFLVQRAVESYVGSYRLIVAAVRWVYHLCSQI